MGNEFVKVEIDDSDLTRVFADLPIITKKAVVEALDITARKVNKNIKSHLTTKYNIPNKAIGIGKSKLVRFRRANVKTNRAVSTIFIKKVGRGLMKYGAKVAGKGVSFQIRKGGTKHVKSGFIAPFKKGSADFAFKKARGSKAGKVTRYTKKGKPYQADKRAILYGPSIASLYGGKSAERVLMKTIDEEFEKNVDIQFAKKFDRKR